MRLFRPVMIMALGATLAMAGPAASQEFLDNIRKTFNNIVKPNPADPQKRQTTATSVKPEKVFSGIKRAFTDLSAMANRHGVDPQYRRATVAFEAQEAPGTIIIDSKTHYLYYVLGNGRALRYGVGVGREGFGWRGTVRIGRKAEWPGWTPPPEMVERERQKGIILPAHMEGGIKNPLGARAMYLYNGGGDTAYRIHGSNEPWTIGHDVSSGCFRMINADVIDLYNRAEVGAKVIVR